MNPFFGTHLGIDWTGILDSANSALKQDGNEFFSIIFGLMFFKACSPASPARRRRTTCSRILATRNPAKPA